MAVSLVAALCALPWPVSARADEKVVLSFVVQLAVAPADVPDTVCVVTSVPPPPHHQNWSSLPPPAADQKEDEWPKGAWPSMATPSDGGRFCGPECTPRVHVEPSVRSSLFVQCQQNEAPFHSAGDEGARLLVIDVEVARSAAPEFQAFRVLGNVITLDALAAGDTSKLVLSARTLGAHYAPRTETTTDHGNVIVLPITRLCTRHIVSVPPFVPRDSVPTSSQDFELSLSLPQGARDGAGTPPFVCAPMTVPFIEGRAEVLLPTNSEEHTLELAATLADSSATFRSWWNDAVAPTVVQMQATSASFSWRVPCIAPHDECPVAMVGQAGVVCSRPSAPELRSEAGRTEKVCRYECPAPEQANAVPVAFNLPADVQFRDTNDRFWTLRLGYANQELDGYIGPAEHSIVVDFKNWISKPAPGESRQRAEDEARRRFVQFVGRPLERINHLELSEEGRPPLHVTPSFDPTTFHLPGVACHDPLVIGIEGERAYSVKFVTVEDDHLVVPAPEELVRDVLSPGGTLGAGLYSPSGSRPFSSPASTGSSRGS